MKRKREGNNISINNKGQALTELAIFGSILLFCVAMLIQYGLDANYQQQAQMEAFRKAQKIAFHKDGPGSSTSLVLVKDKPFPDPRDQWGYAERYPIVGNANVVWNTNLQAQYVTKFPANTLTPKEKENLQADLPAMYFEIDQANKPSQAGAFVPPEAKEDKVFGFYTAMFKKINCPPKLTVVFDDPEHKNPNKTEYIEVPVNKDDIKVMRIEGSFGDLEAENNNELLMSPYFIYEGLKRKITDADVDGDGKLEQIIAADQNKMLFYVDSHDDINKTPSGTAVAGSLDIDTDYLNVAAGDWVWDGQNKKWVELKPEHRQGSLGDFKKEIQHNGSQIVRSEDKGTVTSATTLNATQTIVHEIRLNNGSVVEIPAQFTVKQSELYTGK